MNDEEITSEHTYAYVGQVLEDIELLRLEMGRNRDNRVPMHVRDASSREVFYHSQTLHRKANQLCVELGGESVSPPGAEEPAKAGHADVLRVLESARERLSQARVRLGLETITYKRPDTGPLRRAAGRDDSDLLTGILTASRQLNAMLAQAFTSGNAHERLLRALGTAEQLLEVCGAALPAAPAFERRKFPREVFEVLWQCCDLLNQVLSATGIPQLELRRGFVGEEPGDVFDVTSLIVCELEYIATFVPTEPRSLGQKPPATVLPAHNYQLARQLHAALGALAKVVASSPRWPKGKPNA